jgi:hypothetical protein
MQNLFYEYSLQEVAEQFTIVARNHYVRIKPQYVPHAVCLNLASSLVSLWWSKEGASALAEPITSFTYQTGLQL